ncbi:MAG TPA: cupin domain-containing protein [Bryobacteraceae bacterium]|nr:cupin domain-containing protein [Bryobacteraceae bacterium]
MSTHGTPAAGAGKAKVLNIFGDLITPMVRGADVEGRYAVMEAITPPQGGPPLHRHAREDEWFVVLEGEFVFEVDGERIPLAAGGTILAQKGTAHTFQNVGAAPGRMIVIVRPAGLDSFFEELAGATWGMGEPDLSVVIPIFEKFGLEFLGPPLAVRAPSV